MVTLSRPSVRLLATDIDGTLLNPQFQISEGDLDALRQAHAAGIEIVLVTGRRHTFALPIAKQLGFDLWLISSNGAVTRSLSGETFHRDMMPAETCRRLCSAMQEFRGNTVLTFDKETKGAIVLEHMDELGASIRRWLEKNMEYIEFVIPIEGALVTNPVQAMFCGTMARMSLALRALERAGLDGLVTVLRTEYPERDLSNDVEMLEFAGHPIIMGNACEELRGRGWRVTGGNHECGVAGAVGIALQGIEIRG